MALLSRTELPRPRRGRGRRRVLGIALLAFGLSVAGLLGAAWLAGEVSELEAGYRGFD